MTKPLVYIPPEAVTLIRRILTNGEQVEISLVGKRLRIQRVHRNNEYDVMLSEWRA